MVTASDRRQLLTSIRRWGRRGLSVMTAARAWALCELTRPVAPPVPFPVPLPGVHNPELLPPLPGCGGSPGWR